MKKIEEKHKVKTFYSNVTVSFGGNEFEAKNKKDYIQKVKESFYQEFGLDLEDSEITDIEEA